MLKRLIAKANESEYIKNISIQIFGTGIAQIIPILVISILSRIYSEEDFAIYTSFVAIVSVLSVATGARYQYAIVLPKNEKEAYNVFTLSIYCTLIYTILLSILILFFNVYSTNLLHIKYSEIIIPLYILLYGIWLSKINLSIRNKKFKINSISKIIQSSSNSFLSLGLGFNNISMGLIIGKLVGVLSSIFYLKTKLKLKLKNLIITYDDLKLTARKYKSFPIYGILPSFFDVASLQAPVFIIGKFFTLKILGFYGLTVMALAGPISIISVAFRDVFYQKISEMYNKKDSSGIKKIFKNSVITLFAIAIPAMLILFFFAEPLFEIIFGEEWRESGRYASILIASFLIKLIVSPLSSIFNVVDKLQIVSIWQLFYFITTFLTLLISVIVFKVDIIVFLKIYLIHEIILYLLYFVLQYLEIQKIKFVCAE